MKPLPPEPDFYCNLCELRAAADRLKEQADRLHLWLVAVEVASVREQLSAVIQGIDSLNTEKN